MLGGRGAAAVRHVPGDQAVATQARVDVKEPRPIEQPAPRRERSAGQQVVDVGHHQPGCRGDRQGPRQRRLELATEHPTRSSTPALRAQPAKQVDVPARRTPCSAGERSALAFGTEVPAARLPRTPKLRRPGTRRRTTSAGSTWAGPGPGGYDAPSRQTPPAGPKVDLSPNGSRSQAAWTRPSPWAMAASLRCSDSACKWISDPLRTPHPRVAKLCRFLQPRATCEQLRPCDLDVAAAVAAKPCRRFDHLRQRRR